jgi:predicted RNase H-like nuclease (RuvC/YqgF family)
MTDNCGSRARELKAIDMINPFEERGKKMTDKQPNQFVLIDQVMNELKNVMQNIETLKADLERMTAQRDQLETEVNDLQESTKKEMAIRDTEIDKLNNELQRETKERKATVDLLLNSFSQIQNLMNSVQHNVTHDKGQS